MNQHDTSRGVRLLAAAVAFVLAVAPGAAVRAGEGAAHRAGEEDTVSTASKKTAPGKGAGGDEAMKERLRRWRSLSPEQRRRLTRTDKTG